MFAELCYEIVTDTIYVGGNEAYNLLGDDTTFCFIESITLISSAGGEYYNWSTVDTTGIYALEVGYSDGYYFMIVFLLLSTSKSL